MICFKTSKASTWFFTSSIVFVCCSKGFTKGEYAILACSIILLWSDGKISLPVRYSYLSFFPDDNAHIFASSLLILYCSFSSLILSSIFMINFYIVSKRFFLKRKELSDGRVVSITKKEYGWIKSWKSISEEWLNAICWSFLLFGIFTTKYCVEFNLMLFGTAKYDCVIRTREIFIFLLLMNNSIGLSYYRIKFFYY